MKHTLAAFLFLAIVLPAASPLAQTPTPEATEITEIRETGQHILVVVTRYLDVSTNIGFATSCDRTTGNTFLAFSFGSFPHNKYVQLGIALPNGSIERFGKPVIAPSGPAAGFHDPILQQPAEVLRGLRAAFTTGALISNGHNSIWNRISPQENSAALRRILTCMDTGNR